MESNQSKLNMLYNDHQFPPDIISLYNDKNDLKEDSITYMKSLKWKRANEVVGKIGIENENIQPNDIKQGSIGNCYFLSALSSLAQYPERVLNMFVNLEEQKIGKYNKAHVAQPLQGNAGQTDVALSFLTGAPCKYVDHVKKEHELWQTLLESDKKLHITASTVSKQKEESKEILNDNGISNNHAYSVIKLQIAQLQDGNEEKLINLRNPWGKGDDWNKNDKKWTLDLQKKLAYEYLQKGEFWMSIQDFQTQFHNSQICMVNDFFFRNILKVPTQKEQFYAFEFDVKQELDIEELHLIVYQMNEKLGEIKYGEFKQSEVQILIGRKETNQNIKNQFPIDFVASRKAEKYETVISNFDKLIPGKYLLLLEIDWTQSFAQDIVIAAYSAQDIKLTQVQYDHSMLENMLKSCAYKFSETRSYFIEEDFQDSFYCLDFQCTRVNYGIYFVQNNSSRNITLEIEFIKIEGCQIMYPNYKNGEKLDLKVDSQGNNCILVKFNKCIKQDFSINYRLQIYQMTFFVLVQIKQKIAS